MEILLSHRRSQVGFNEFEPSCANIEGRGKTDATSLGSCRKMLGLRFQQVAEDLQVWEQNVSKCYI